MTSISMAPAPGMQQIDLSKLNINQLAQLKQQIDQELGVFQDSLEALKMAQGKFIESGDCVDKISPSTQGRSALVPLTGSMYVPGVVADTSNVIIDIGTGYYAQKDLEGAKDYFKRKVEFVTEQMYKIQLIGQEKKKVQDTICKVIEMKMTQAQSAAQAGKPSAS